MPPKTPKNRPSKQFRLRPDELRWRCDPAMFDFNTTQDLERHPINIIGQPRALEALELGLSIPSEGYNIFVSGQVGSGLCGLKGPETSLGTSGPGDLILSRLVPDGEPHNGLSRQARLRKVWRNLVKQL